MAYENAERIRDIGRLLMATEVRSMLTYWHVQAPGTPGVSRVYPGGLYFAISYSKCGPWPGFAMTVH